MEKLKKCVFCTEHPPAVCEIRLRKGTPEVVTWYRPSDRGPRCDIASSDWDRRWDELVSSSGKTIFLCRYAAVVIRVES